MSAIKETIHSAASMRAGVDQDKRWVTAAFTWNGLRALGLDEATLASFPEEFKQGMAARAEMLGDAGANAPEHWVGGLASPDLHAIVILFARDDAEHDRCVSEHEKLIASCPGVEVLSVLDLQGHSAVWLRARAFRLPRQVVGAGHRGKWRRAHARYRRTSEARRVHPWLSRRIWRHGRQSSARILARNGSYMAYRRLEEHVGKFREFLRQHGDTAGGAGTDRGQADGAMAQRCAARARARNKTIRHLGADTQRNNDFTYKELDPHGYAVPLGSHIRRMNPRDTGHNMNRRRMIRRGAPYGPPLPEGAPDDGVERGIAAFVICASLIRQFEFAQNVWINDRNFNELGNERDPIIGAQDGTLEFKIPKRPIRKKIVGLPAFTTSKGRRVLLSPGCHWAPWREIAGILPDASILA